MKKNLVIGTGIYVLILLFFSSYKIIKGEQNYSNYKRYIETAKVNVENGKKENSSNPSVISENKEKVDSSTVGTNETTVVKEENQSKNIQSQNNKVDGDYSQIKFTKPLRKGSKGEDVKKLQALLKKKGHYIGEITGDFGNDTEIALKKFQASIKVIEDGVLGPGTWTKLSE